jgi:hypothetical protein
MKKILVSLLTFTIGIFASFFFNFEESVPTENFIPVQPISQQTSELNQNYFSLTEQTIQTNVENSFKPFFDSFDKDESYSGWFIAENFKGMKEVWAISLDRDWENEKNEKLIWSANIRTSDTQEYSTNPDYYFHSVKINTEKSKFSFKTNKIRGIEYKFYGEFHKTFYQFNEGEKVLKGTLQKFVKGKKVAEFTADFAYYEPKCTH